MSGIAAIFGGGRRKPAEAATPAMPDPDKERINQMRKGQRLTSRAAEMLRVNSMTGTDSRTGN